MSEHPHESWSPVVALIRAGDPDGQAALYHAFAPGLRLFLQHHLQQPEDVEDRLHDIIVQVVMGIQKGNLTEPERLAGFIRTIARRQVALFIHQAVRQREMRVDWPEDLISEDPDPEQAVVLEQWRERASQILASLNETDREILLRFYWLGQEPEDICQDLALTHDQFRLRKSRAKARFGQEFQRQPEQNSPDGVISMRKKSVSAH